MASNFPVTNVRIDGNQLSYTSNESFSGVMLMNSQLNVGAGPPTIEIIPGTQTTAVPLAVGGGQPYHLFYQGRRLCEDFIASGSGFVPPPPPPPPPSIIYPMPPPVSVLVGEEHGVNEIEIRGERGLGPDADGKLWCFASKDVARLGQGVERLRTWLAA